MKNPVFTTFWLLPCVLIKFLFDTQHNVTKFIQLIQTSIVFSASFHVHTAAEDNVLLRKKKRMYCLSSQKLVRHVVCDKEQRRAGVIDVAHSNIRK